MSLSFFHVLNISNKPRVHFRIKGNGMRYTSINMDEVGCKSTRACLFQDHEYRGFRGVVIAQADATDNYGLIVENAGCFRFFAAPRSHRRDAKTVAPLYFIDPRQHPHFRKRFFSPRRPRRLSFFCVRSNALSGLSKNCPKLPSSLGFTFHLKVYVFLCFRRPSKSTQTACDQTSNTRP